MFMGSTVTKDSAHHASLSGEGLLHWRFQPVINRELVISIVLAITANPEKSFKTTISSRRELSEYYFFTTKDHYDSLQPL